MKNLLKPGIYWMFVFIPVAIYLEHIHASASMVFFAAALSIIPIARLIGSSTEHLSSYTGDSVGSLLNASFGNLPELIIAIVALKAGLYEMVLASFAGAILANLLLATGASFLVGGLKYHNQEYNVTTIRLYSSMMLIAVISLTIPSGFHMPVTDPLAGNSEERLNLILALSLLVTYGLYLFFMIKTHADFFKSAHSESGQEHEGRWSVTRALLTLVGSSVMAAFMSEILVGAATETGTELGMSAVFIGVIFLAVVGGAAESISAVTMAAKNKMDLSIGIAIGSSIQIALFVAPVLVIISSFVGEKQLNLTFGRPMVVALFLTVILAAIVAGDGRSNWFKGVQLILVYSIMAMMLYFIPTAV